jgi:hypothetical protein
MKDKSINQSISDLALDNLKTMQDMSITSSAYGKILVLTELKLHIQTKINEIKTQMDDKEPLRLTPDMEVKS